MIFFNCLFVVDIIVLSACGNLADLISLAVYSALSNASIPTVCLVETEEGTDFSIDTDPINGVNFPKTLLRALPLRVSLYSIGRAIVADPSEEEQAVATCSMSVLVNRNNEICSTCIENNGSIKLGDIAEYLSNASVISREMFLLLDSEL